MPMDIISDPNFVVYEGEAGSSGGGVGGKTRIALALWFWGRKCTFCLLKFLFYFIDFLFN